MNSDPFSAERQAALQAKYPPFAGHRIIRRNGSARARRATEAALIPSVLKRTLQDFCGARAISLDELIGPSRTARMCALRDEAMALTCERRGANGHRLYSYARIGRFFGGRDHSTVIAAVRRHEARRAT